jgi:hypothetical protein
VDDLVVSAAPLEVVSQNFQSLQLKRKRRPRWGLDVPLAQEEEEQALLVLSFFHHQQQTAAGSSSQLDVDPMSVEPLALEDIDHLWVRVERSNCQCVPPQ